jgi:hypothetical protein
MNVPPLFLYFAGFAVICQIAVELFRHFSGPPCQLREWARSHGFQILRSEYRAFKMGPFTWKLRSRSQQVYYIRVADSEGKERTGWFLTSAWGSEDAQVRWDEDD